MATTTRSILVKDLIAYTESEEYRNSAVVPISPHRARSHVHNPRARPHDLALFLVYENGDLVGYVGAIPERYFTATQEALPIAWLSCLWVSPSMRGRGIAQKLLATISEHYHKQVFVTGFTPESKVLYDRLGFFEEQKTPPGLRGYLRPNFADILPPKGGFWPKIKPLLLFLDTVLGFFNGLRLLFYAPKMPEIQVVDHLDAEIEAFIQQHNSDEYTRRSTAELNWILQFPWLIPPNTKWDAHRYYFSSVAKRFQYFVFTTRNTTGQLTGLVFLSLRERHLKLIYAQLEEEALTKAARAIAAYALQQGAAMVTVFDERLATAIHKDRRAPFFYTRAVQNRYLISTAFDLQSNFRFQDGDGDAAFT
jgi:GNAT superfamily N-acetyltransferase